MDFDVSFESNETNFNTGFVEYAESFHTDFDSTTEIRGLDGYSPSVKLTQLDNGVQVVVTDADGTATATIYNGTNGEQGYTPVKGLDYFTEGDVAEIAAVAADKVDLSDYVSEAELERKGYLTEHQSLADYATTDEVTSLIADAIGGIENGTY